MNEDNEDYIYIIINNINPVDFQSFVIKYKSWDKFINDIQDINYKTLVNGTMCGLLHPRNAVVTIDFQDETHAKYHFDIPLLNNCYVYAYVEDKEHMERVVNDKSKIY